MIRSIRHFLLISLLISMTIASSVTAIGNYLLDKQVIQPYLDEQLLKLFTFIEVISHTAMEDPHIQSKIYTYINETQSSGAKNLLFQVWTTNKKLLIFSENSAKETMLNVPLGFSDIEIDN